MVSISTLCRYAKGYNGTVMAYGQTGTGKTHTLGARGYDDPAERGIMRRAVAGLALFTTLLCSQKDNR